MYTMSYAQFSHVGMDQYYSGREGLKISVSTLEIQFANLENHQFRNRDHSADLEIVNSETEIKN